VLPHACAETSGLSAVMAGLVPASRIYPTCGTFLMRKSGKPDFRCHPRLRFARVKTWMPATIAGMTELVALDAAFRPRAPLSAFAKPKRLRFGGARSADSNPPKLAQRA
jgi:hypothetical protein